MRAENRSRRHGRAKLVLLTIVSLALRCGASTLADSVVSIDTGSLSGTSGDLAFDFISGGSSLNSVTISGFSSDGTPGAVTPSGSVTGTLPGAVTLTTADFFNEYLTGFTFATTISFTVSQTENAPAAGGVPDEFSFYLLDSTGSNSLITTSDPTGADAVFALGSDQSQAVYRSPEVTTTVQTVATVPEPGTFGIWVFTLCGLILLRVRRRVGELRRLRRWAAAALAMCGVTAAMGQVNPADDIGPPFYQFQGGGALYYQPTLPIIIPAPQGAQGCVSYSDYPTFHEPAAASPPDRYPLTDCSDYSSSTDAADDMFQTQSLDVSTTVNGVQMTMAGLTHETADELHVYASANLYGVGPSNGGIADAAATYYQQNLLPIGAGITPGTPLTLTYDVKGAGIGAGTAVWIFVWSDGNEAENQWYPNSLTDVTGKMSVTIVLGPSGRYTILLEAFTLNENPNTQTYAYASWAYENEGFAVGQWKTVDAFDDPSSNTTVRGVTKTGEKAGVAAPDGGPTTGWSETPQGTFESLVAPGDNAGYTVAYGMNDSGTIVGAFQQKEGASSAYHGFLYKNSSYTTYDIAGAASTELLGINDAGDLVGNSTVSGQPEQGFLQLASGGAPIAFAIPNASLTSVDGVNSSHTVVGRWVDPNNVTHGFIQAVGGTPISFDFPGATGTYPYSITDAGTVSGYFIDTAGNFHGFVGPITGLRQYDLSGTLKTAATALNNEGVVAGTFQDSAGIEHGFTAQICDPDISSQFKIAGSGFLLNHATGEFTQQVTVTNISGKTVSGPLLVLFRNLPNGVMMDKGNQISGCVAPGAPFVTANLPGGKLGPGKTFTVTADFANYSKGGITYTPAVLQGSGIP